jgi:hypothetical protein
MKRSQNDSGNVSRNDLMQQRAHCSRLRYDVNARLDVNIFRKVASVARRRVRMPNASDIKRYNARERMIDNMLKALALTALASIAIGAVRWLVRRPTALLLVLMILGASTLLIQ